jgi:hypothetical protein
MCEKKVKNMAISNFHQYLLDNLTASQMDGLVGDLGIKSHHRLNHLFRKPELATFDEVLFFSGILNCTPYSLVDQFNLGRNTLGMRAIVYLMDKDKKELNGQSMAAAT